jgi:3-(methylthio)propanoyl-CoA dehydrogenase
MGFCEDTGAAQVFRDIRIAAIYEGTNGIQALDLFGRKLPMRNGEVIAELFAEMSLVLPELEASPLTADLAKPLGAALNEVRALTEWMLTEGRTNVADGMAGATPYLRVLSTLVGGWLMARQAVLAVSSTSASATDSFFSAKVATARFYLTQILPTVEGLYEQVRATSAPLYAIPAAALASS